MIRAGGGWPRLLILLAQPRQGVARPWFFQEPALSEVEVAGGDPADTTILVTPVTIPNSYAAQIPALNYSQNGNPPKIKFPKLAEHP